MGRRVPAAAIAPPICAHRSGTPGREPFHADLRTKARTPRRRDVGFGKSEFLQAWIPAWPMPTAPDRVTSPDRLQGWSAFAKCTALPHCVGLVTDLSPYLVRRAMSSLRAEIRYRELLLNDKGVKDLIEVGEDRRSPTVRRAWVIVVGRTGVSGRRVPDFVDNLVDIAQRGRSLRTASHPRAQRPAGVVRENIRRTPISEWPRMSDEDNSSDVIGTAVAAHFDPSIPGGASPDRPGRLVQFQAAYPGARTPAVPPAPPIGIVELGFGASRT